MLGALAGKATAIMAGALALSVAANGLLLWRVSSLSARAERVAAEADKAAAASINSAKAAATLEAALADCIGQAEASASAAAESRRREQAAEAQSRRLRDQARTEREVIYADDQDCDAWARSLVCHRIAARLRVGEDGGGGPAP